jgi:hypothetical protein
VISSVLIEALARRAMQVYAYAEGTGVAPTVPVFRSAFTDELQRFDNSASTSTVHTPANPTAHVSATRAKLIADAPSGSLGKGIGQQTGGSASSDAEEAQRILKIITNVSADSIAEHCGTNAASIITYARTGLGHNNLYITGRQLFAMRSIKDQLIEKGIV